MNQSMLAYHSNIKHKARQLRKAMTESERLLWSRLRGKQILGVQFYRQKPIGNYIVDFYASKAKLVVEVDGSQHQEKGHAEKDKRRDAFLSQGGLEVIRFSSRDVMTKTEAVVQTIYQKIAESQS